MLIVLIISGVTRKDSLLVAHHHYGLNVKTHLQTLWEEARKTKRGGVLCAANASKPCLGESPQGISGRVCVMQGPILRGEGQNLKTERRDITRFVRL